MKNACSAQTEQAFTVRGSTQVGDRYTRSIRP